MSCFFWLGEGGLSGGRGERMRFGLGGFVWGERMIAGRWELRLCLGDGRACRTSPAPYLVAVPQPPPKFPRPGDPFTDMFFIYLLYLYSKLPQYPPATLAFQRLSYAYETLSNDATRRIYDLGGSTGRSYDPGSFCCASLIVGGDGTDWLFWGGWMKARRGNRRIWRDRGGMRRCMVF